MQKSHYDEADAAFAGLEEARRRTEAEYSRGLLDDLAKAEQKAAGLRQDVIKAEQRTSLLRLTAQEDAVVQQLAVYSIGGVVTPAQTLMVLVPSSSGLEIEAMVSNRDIGFIRAGQEAAIKIDTFSFTRYGLRKGEVLSVSHDAIVRTKPPDRNGDAGAGTETSSSEPKGQELIYSARISLDSKQMQVDDRLVNLAPGMAVTVEIKNGSRRSSTICSRRCCATARRACASGEIGTVRPGGHPAPLGGFGCEPRSVAIHGPVRPRRLPKPPHALSPHPVTICDIIITLKCQFDNVRGAADAIGMAGAVRSPGVVVGSADHC